jgi:CSLREA domain-containing protein
MFGYTRLATLITPARQLLTLALLVTILGLTPPRIGNADTNLVVNTIADTDDGSCRIAICSLRDAINAANAVGAGPATITFNTAGSAVGISGTIVLTSTLPAIDNDITIDGTGHTITVSGNNAVRVMVVNAGKALHLQSITITDGKNRFVGYGDGAGIYNGGTASVSNSTISGNWGLTGAGIYNTGALIVTNSTLAGNYAEGGFGGGGIYNTGALTVTNSALADNISVGSSFSDGGGILNNGTASVNNSTFWGNAVYARYPSGGGVYNAGVLTLTNTVIANSPNGGDCVGPASGGHNLIQATFFLACNLTNGINNNLIGVDPLLEAPADNGGSTLTQLLLSGSPAINAGDNASCPAFDQRGVARPQGGICDIDSVESLSWPRARLIMVMR